MTEERRRQPRLALTMPVRVSGFAADGHPWTEMSTLKDATASGAATSGQASVARDSATRAKKTIVQSTTSTA